ncbi:amidohydrolase family protein [Rhizobium halophytocola]|uniref:L-fuconolactonase n=1 Tax=Rhizobium halophytocola TaxID=735519 RepID=A0ABS4E532_9HYPH|nr:amidohydrolase family protein [Rhizobium halophytocola]MBP1853045.1 L-fuconolactonase [Rhizobium halophytocola]
MSQIDAHCHFWSLQRGDYGWLRADDPGLAPICRDFGPEDIATSLADAGRERLVVVQAAPTDAETAFLLSLADGHPEIAGVVGWTDLSAPDAATRITTLARARKLKGLRPMLQDLGQDDWILTAPQPNAISAMVEHGLRLDALVLPRHLDPLARFVERHPDLQVIIDHAAKPPLSAGGNDHRHDLWRSGMQRLAAFPHVHCKLSGLLTEMDPAQCREINTALAVLQPLFDDLLRWFGPTRLVWGSDWPVLRLAASYDFWADLTDRLLGDLDATDRRAILGGNAERFYDLKGAAT